MDVSMQIRGSIVAIVTPFLSDGELDIPALHGLIDMHLTEGTHAIVCCGTTGEAPTLEEEEQIRVIQETVTRVAGRIPVIAGTGSNCTKKAITMTQRARACGADACLVVVPYYNRPMFEGIKGHFHAVADVGLPVIFYHHPSRTGLKLPCEQLVDICEHPMIYGIKEGSGDLDLMQQFIRFSNKPLFSGDDVIALPQMAAGAQGIISIVANVIPRQWSQFATACLIGDFAQAHQIYGEVAELCQSLVLETNPQGVKFALSLLEKCQSTLRLPMLIPRFKTQKAIFAALEKMGLAKAQAEAVSYIVD